MPSIYIDGVGHVDAKGFAEEQTLQRIAFNIEALRHASGAKLDTKSQKALNREAGKAATSLGKVTGEFKQAGHAAGAAYAGLIGLERVTTSIGYSFKKAARGIEGSGNELGAGISAAGALITSAAAMAVQGVGSVTSMFGSTGAALGKLGTLLVGGAIAGFSALVGVVAQTATDFGKLQQAGGLFGGSLGTVRLVAQEAGLTLAQYSNVMRKSTHAFSMFGGQTTKGAIWFGKLNKGVQQMYEGDFLRLGIGYEEMAERNAESVAQFALAGESLKNMPTAAAWGLVAKRTKDLAVQQKILAAFTGTTLEQEREKHKAFTQDKNMRAILAGQSLDVRDAMKGLAGATDAMHPGLKRLAAQYFVHGGATDEMGAALESQFGAIAGPMKEFVLGVKAGTHTMNDIPNFLNQIDPDALLAQQRQAAELTSIMYTTGVSFGTFGDMMKDGVIGPEEFISKLKDGTLDAVLKDMKTLGKDPDQMTDAFIKTTEDLQKAAVFVQEGINNLLFKERDNLDVIGELVGGGTSLVAGVSGQILNASEQFAILTKNTLTLNTAFGGLIKWVEKYLPNSSLSGRAAGGPVMAGKSYILGERGPEEVSFGQSGVVTSNNKLYAMMEKAVSDSMKKMKKYGTTASPTDQFTSMMLDGNKMLAEMTKYGTTVSQDTSQLAGTNTQNGAWGEAAADGVIGMNAVIGNLRKQQVEDAMLALPRLLMENTDAVTQANIDNIDSLHNLRTVIA